jgi:hypothetical protein
MYYVYAYLDPTIKIKDENFKYKPFYIGKGTKDRDSWHLKHKDKLYNKLFKDKIDNLLDSGITPEVVRYIDNVKNSKAYLIEHELIKLYGRMGLDDDGILTNRSMGLEHFNIVEGCDLKDQLKKADMPHFNKRQVPEDIQNRICELYSDNNGFKYIRDELKDEYKIGFAKIRSILEGQGIHIRTKSETSSGENNSMYGKKRGPNSHFKGRKHTEESKNKISNSLKLKYTERDT